MPIKTRGSESEPEGFAWDALIGLVQTHVVEVEEPCRMGSATQYLHPQALEAFRELRSDAQGAGFDLRVVSGFRSFERQMRIWNDKALGKRAVLDARESPLDVAAMGARELLYAILRWTALPGTSRHHWGSDLDVEDAAACVEESVLELRVDLCRGSGRSAPLHRWLDQRIAADDSYGFFRPYTGVGCAVAEEPWHLSFAPVAATCQSSLDVVHLYEVLRSADIQLLEEVESSLQDILIRYVQVPALLYPQQWQPRARGVRG
jgi:hypothetical protein